jgi:Caspase domain
MSGKRALLIGIDDYPEAPLLGCVADADAMASMLRAHANGERNYTVKTLTHPREAVGRSAIRAAMEELFSNAPHFDLFFYFSGHGRRTAFGAELVGSDLEGVSLGDLLALANGSAAKSVTIVLDCCFSGDVGNAGGLQPIQVAEEFRKNISVLADGVAVLAASRPTQPALEAAGQGVFTRLLLDGLSGGATDHVGKVTALSLYAYASAALGEWDQRPIFKAHLADTPVLRIGPPWLDPALLRRLPEMFSTRDSRVCMTPAHEGEGRPFPPGVLGTPEQQAFDYFKKLRNAGLLTTDNDEDHYFVAMNSREVYLTPLGRYFWDRAKRQQL